MRTARGEKSGKRGAKASVDSAPAPSSERRTLASFMLETNGGGALEQVPGFNDRRAMTAGFQSTRLPGPEPIFVGYRPDTGGIVPPMTLPPQFGVNLENVIGSDDRVLIPDTTPTPWRCVCQLVITYEGGLQGFGTGWLLGARTVITAGHCLHDPNTGKKALQVQVVPGRNGASAPFGFLVASDFRVCEGWPDKNDPALDFGAVFLPENSITPRIGWFGVGCFPDDELEHLLVNNSGYPYDPRKPFGTQWFNGGRIQNVEPNFVSYMIDTEGGQSGSPVFFFDTKTKQRQVVAIHTTGHFPNRGIRVTERVFRHLEQWRDGH